MSKRAVAIKRGEGTSLSILGTEVRFLCQAESSNRKFSVMEVIVPKNEGIPPHIHPWDEAYYVVEGGIIFQVGNRRQTLNSGDFIYAPGGMLHGFDGITEQPARLLVLDVPATAEEFFKEVEREVKSYPTDLTKLLEIASRYQIEFRA